MSYPLKQHPRAVYEKIEIDHFELLMAELGKKGGDLSLRACLRCLHEQIHVRELIETTRKTTQATLIVFCVLAAIAVFVPILRLKVLATLANVLVLCFFGSSLYFWATHRSEFKANRDELSRARDASLTALVRIVRSGNLSPYALDPDERSTLGGALRASGRSDPELLQLLQLTTPSDRHYRYRDVPDL